MGLTCIVARIAVARLIQIIIFTVPVYASMRCDYVGFITAYKEASHEKQGQDSVYMCSHKEIPRFVFGHKTEDSVFSVEVFSHHVTPWGMSMVQIIF